MSDFFPMDQISRITEPLHWDDRKNALMVEACRDMAEFHYKNSDDVRALYDSRGYRPGSLLKESDLQGLPYFGVSAMKYFLMTSQPADRAVLKLTSSGTKGQKTQVWFDQASLDRAQGMLDVLWEQEGLTSDKPTNYACFIYDPDEARDLGIAFSIKNEQRFAPAKNSFFTIRKNEKGEWEFQKERTLLTLKAYVAQGLPVRILGVPSFIHELVLHLKEAGPLTLPCGSFMFTGGGWKAAEDKSITREQFREEVFQTLGIPAENIRDGFGMAEHGAPYIECEAHRFHIPVYNRILVRDPVTLTVVAPGKTGLMEFISPLNTMMPSLAILSTDLGYIDPLPCACGKRSPTFTLVRRGGVQKHKGCAITAGEIVKRG